MKINFHIILFKSVTRWSLAIAAIGREYTQESEYLLLAFLCIWSKWEVFVGTDREGSIPQLIHVTLAETAPTVEKKPCGLEKALPMWKVQATGDRISTILRHDSEPYRGQGRDRMCLGNEDKPAMCWSGEPAHVPPQAKGRPRVSLKEKEI